MPRPVHFEFIAEDPERAARFWSEAFGWKVDKWNAEQPYWLVSTDGEGGDEPGIDGGIADKRVFDLPGHTIVTLSVGSVDDAIARVEAAGGAVVAPKMAIPGVGWLAYCRDTEGTVFGTMEPDDSAALDSAALGSANLDSTGSDPGLSARDGG
jgi:hypothetical protein